METVMRWELKSVSDEKLLADLSTLVSEQQRRDAELIAHIAEVNRRRLFLDLGYSSMFAYCTKKLHLSDSAAYRRITVGRLALTFPCVLDAIAEGRVHVTGVSLLAPIVKADNVERLLAAATHRNKREIERIVATEAPKPDVPTTVRKVPAVTVLPQGDLLPERVDAVAQASAPAATSAKAASQAAPAFLMPLASDRYSIKVTVSQATHDKLRRAQALLRHAVPSGDVAEVLDRALDALIEKVEKRKNGAADRPRESEPPAQGSRHIPSHVKREVVRRDQHRCAYIAADGTRCSETSWLEFDHIVPVACGGQSTVDNVRQCCRAHNLHRARKQFGDRCGERLGVWGSCKIDRAMASWGRGAVLASSLAVGCSTPAPMAPVPVAIDADLAAVQGQASSVAVGAPSVTPPAYPLVGAGAAAVAAVAVAPLGRVKPEEPWRDFDCDHASINALILQSQRPGLGEHELQVIIRKVRRCLDSPFAPRGIRPVGDFPPHPRPPAHDLP
jgi:hypothetical protein